MMRVVTVGHGGNTDFVCDGIADEIEINAAIEFASAEGHEVVVTGDYPDKVKEEMRVLANKNQIKITFRV